MNLAALLKICAGRHYLLRNSDVGTDQFKIILIFTHPVKLYLKLRRIENYWNHIVFL